MKRIGFALFFIAGSVVYAAGASSPTAKDAFPDTIVVAKHPAPDVIAISTLAKDWEEAWNRRDAAGLAAIMAADVTFVSVLGPDTPGYGEPGTREGFERSHAALFKTMFANSRWMTRSVRIVRYLGPDAAVAQVSWATTGDRVRHVRHGVPRRGTFLWVVERQNGKWKVVASQNTEAMPALEGQ